MQLKPIISNLSRSKKNINTIKTLFEDKEITKKLFNIELDILDVVSCIRRKYIRVEKKKENVRKKLPYGD